MPFDIQAFYNDVYGFNTNDQGTSLANTISVFEAGYISSSKDASLTKAQAGYFSLGPSSAVSTLFGSNDAASENSGGVTAANFWQIIITGITEGHSEKSLVHNTLSENVSVFSAGAMPVQVSITGMLLRTRTDDHHFEFLQRYVDGLRARRLSLDDRTCTFVSKDTSFKLIIEALVLESSVDNETYVNISIQGHAYGYKMTNSHEPLQLGYYGTEYPVATSGVKKEELESSEQGLEGRQSSSDPETTMRPVTGNTPRSTQPTGTIKE